MIWLILAPFDFAVSLLAFVVAPFIVLFTSRFGVAPAWAWPWLTHDNPIDGDDGHWQRWPDNGTRWRAYCRRVAWLWRNRGYSFSYRVCGAETDQPVRIIAGRPFWRDASPTGWCVATCGSAWMLFVWLPWGRPFGIKRGLRIYLGWKLRGKLDNPSSTTRAMLVTHINPLKGVM